MSERIWILGAPDPEMESIEALLRECGETVRHATAPSGERIRPGQYGAPIHIGDATTVYTVECDPPLACGEPEDEPDAGQVTIDGRRYMAARRCVEVSVIRIDHHCPGDPGYGRPPSEFLAASSIGQVIAELALAHALRLDWAPCYHRQPYGWQSQAPQFEPYYGCGHTRGRLGWVGSPARWAVGYPAAHTDAIYIPAEIVLIAAADHCLGAAYRGECPGVDPDALMRWRAESRARFQGRPVAEVLADVERAQAALRAAPELVLLEDPCSDVVVRDMRQSVDQRPTRELPEAAVRLGIGYVSGPLVGPDGRQKITCSGTADQVRAFLDHWAPAQGLVDAYGDPARGFAGAYLPTEAP